MAGDTTSPPKLAEGQLYEHITLEMLDKIDPNSKPPTQPDSSTEQPSSKPTESERPKKPAFAFTPTQLRRPQPQQQRGKPNRPRAMLHGPPKAVISSGPKLDEAALASFQNSKTTLETSTSQFQEELKKDLLTVNPDDDAYWLEKRAHDQAEKRAKDKARKKAKKQNYIPKPAKYEAPDWDAVYTLDKHVPAHIFAHSDEYYRQASWWTKLVRGVRARGNSQESDGRARTTHFDSAKRNPMFAPPAAFNTSERPVPARSRSRSISESEGDYDPDSMQLDAGPPVAPTPSSVPVVFNDASGDDAYARRLALSQQQQQAAPPPPPPPPPQITGTIHRVAQIDLGLLAQAQAEAAQKAENDVEMTDANASNDQQTLKRKNVNDHENRHMSYGQRLMEKMGYKKGQGLGARGTGIIKPLEAKIDKRSRTHDETGSVILGRGGQGKITGGQMSAAGRAEAREMKERFGEQSTVVRLGNILAGYDKNHEDETGELINRLGEALDKRVGKVQQIKMGWVVDAVFVRFTNINSAIMGRSNMHDKDWEGRMVEARFFDEDAFERQEWV